MKQGARRRLADDIDLGRVARDAVELANAAHEKFSVTVRASYAAVWSAVRGAADRVWQAQQETDKRPERS
jgi:hypothetical protein